MAGESRRVYGKCPVWLRAVGRAVLVDEVVVGCFGVVVVCVVRVHGQGIVGIGGVDGIGRGRRHGGGDERVTGGWIGRPASKGTWTSSRWSSGHQRREPPATLLHSSSFPARLGAVRRGRFLSASRPTGVYRRPSAPWRQALFGYLWLCAAVAGLRSRPPTALTAAAAVPATSAASLSPSPRLHPPRDAQRGLLAQHLLACNVAATPCHSVRVSAPAPLPGQRSFSLVPVLISLHTPVARLLRGSSAARLGGAHRAPDQRHVYGLDVIHSVHIPSVRYPKL